MKKIRTKTIVSVTDLKRAYLKEIGSKAATGTTENVASTFNSLLKGGKLDRIKFRLAMQNIEINLHTTLIKIDKEYFEPENTENTEGV